MTQLPDEFKDLDPLLLAYLAKAQEKIAKYGVLIQAVHSGEGTPEFSYTVGLIPLGHPEFVVVGLAPDTAAVILNDLADRVHSDESFRPGQRLSDVIVGYDIVLLAVDPVTARAEGVGFGVADALYGYGDTVPILQVAFPDYRGRFPWDAGCDFGDRAHILGPVPHDLP